MSQEKHNEVFEAYPEADAIYVVDNMPFLTEAEANAHKRYASVGAKVEKIVRPSKADADPQEGDKTPGPPDADPQEGDEKPKANEGEKANKKGKK